MDGRCPRPDGRCCRRRVAHSVRSPWPVARATGATETRPRPESDPTFTNQVWTKPDEGGFNSYNPTAYAEDLSEYLFDPLTQYNP